MAGGTDRDVVVHSYIMLSTRSRQKRGVPGDSVLTGLKDRCQDSGCPLGGVTGQGGHEGGFWKLEMSLDLGTCKYSVCGNSNSDTLMMHALS